MNTQEHKLKIWKCWFFWFQQLMMVKTCLYENHLFEYKICLIVQLLTLSFYIDRLVIKLWLNWFKSNDWFRFFFFRWDLFQFNDDDLNDLHYRYLTPTTKEGNFFPWSYLFSRKGKSSWLSLFHFSLTEFDVSKILNYPKLKMDRFQENLASRNSIRLYCKDILTDIRPCYIW